MPEDNGDIHNPASANYQAEPRPRSNGGTAFPSAEEQTEGMSLRDYFAASALRGLIAGGDDCGDMRVKDVPNDPDRIRYDRREQANRYAETAYILADAMLAARG
jgi:hypothetical protein